MKKSCSELAVFSGAPEFKEPLHVGRPNLGNRENFLRRVDGILDRRWFTNNGILIQEFEAEVAKYLGVKHCIAMCNGTVALEILERALDLKGEVILPSFTFVATAHSLQWQQITPVFCDVDPKTHTLDPDQVERHITPKTTGILGVHIWGRPCNVDALSEIAKRHGLKLFFDAAHAFGSSYQGRMVGGLGDAEVFSFHGTKFINTFEGGAVTTNNDELAAKIRLMKNFGFSGVDKVSYLGTNGKMSEISAAMGLTCLESIATFIQDNETKHRFYESTLSGYQGLSFLQYDAKEKSNYQYMVIDIDEEKTGICRDDIVAALQAEGILARRYFYPGVHRMEPYRSNIPNAGLLLPQTEWLTSRLLCLPTGAAVDTEKQKRVCSVLKLILENPQAVRARLTEANPQNVANVIAFPKNTKVNGKPLNKKNKEKIVVWGASGHAQVVADLILTSSEFEIVGFLDDVNTERKGEIFSGGTVLGGREKLAELKRQGVDYLVVAIGDCKVRQKLSLIAKEYGYVLPTLIHPKATIAEGVSLGAGTVVMAGAVVNSGVVVGENTILNTSCTIEHGCRIGESVHISPGVVLGGEVNVGSASWVGIGATVRDHIRIGKNTLIGGGAVVVSDIGQGIVAYGVPATERKAS